MTTATKITFARVALIPVFMVCMYCIPLWNGLQYVAFAVFAIASLSDFVDGQIARRCNQVTDLGKFLDPLADKVLVIAAMAMLCELDVFPAWALMIVLTREFAVTGLRLVAVGNGRVIAAGWSGKVKTAVTMVGLCFMLVFWRSSWALWLNWSVVAAISATTLYSGVEYFIKNRDVLLAKK
ncbi:MAG: CDP-diacylglycerol--glycerol-3-phosphate 3-phosphatidyltransferase [Oscillospiraceae bacterium]|jgi:CDP-diacylglycerol--glycerol-3-phosphate 3-phosphatidyltransferase|nr:CDP-diacylglycerol--glycerol-3-phosphate 3-phosphatidyltransferase [Oscillospiraceae bacterium]